MNSIEKKENKKKVRENREEREREKKVRENREKEERRREEWKETPINKWMAKKRHSGIIETHDFVST